MLFLHSYSDVTYVKNMRVLRMMLFLQFITLKKGLFQLCEMIARYAVNNREEKPDEIWNKFRNYVENYRNIHPQQNLVTLKKYLLQRCIPYRQLWTALYGPPSDYKIKSSPKCLQLCVMMLIHQVSDEIIKAFNRQNPSQFVSVDIIGIYSTSVWDIIEPSQSNRNNYKRQDSTNCVDNGDPKYENHKAFMEHVFGKLINAIDKRSGANKFCVRIYLNLSDEESKYPQVKLTIQDAIEKKEYGSLLDKSLYNELNTEINPIFAYSIGWMRRRYLNDYKLMSDEAENTQSNNYIMISCLIWPVRQREDLPYIYINKLYLNYANSIIRIYEKDVLEMIPKLFDGTDLKLEMYDKSKKERRKSHISQFDIDGYIENECILYLSTK